MKTRTYFLLAALSFYFVIYAEDGFTGPLCQVCVMATAGFRPGLKLLLLDGFPYIIPMIYGPLLAFVALVGLAFFRFETKALWVISIPSLLICAALVACFMSERKLLSSVSILPLVVFSMLTWRSFCSERKGLTRRYSTTIMSVTDRAPSSTLRASHNRG